MKALIAAGTLSLSLLLAGCGESGGSGGNTSAPAGDVKVASIPAPNGGSWTEVVSETPEGGFVMGNPNAPVKVVEYASMTCSHCAEFSEKGIPQLEEKYVKTGQVSLELRNFVRDPADLAASLLARCSGPTPFFKLTDQLFGAQGEWLGRLQTMSPEAQQALQGMQPQQAVSAMAQQAGLVDFVRVRGVPAEKAQQCLSDQAQLNRLVQMGQRAQQQYPNFPGTPTFIVNGTMAENTANWETLEPKIQEALR